MSDPYIRSLTQKYQLAVALAVLREKPQDISIENYIEELKSKINNEPSEDLDLTLCSDDFDMQESPEKLNNDEEIQVLDEQTNNADSRNILQDFNENVYGYKEITNDSCRIEEVNENIRITEMNDIQKESQAKTQEFVNSTQIQRQLDSNSTFCETQNDHNYLFNPNEVYTNNYNTIFKINEVTEPNEAHLNGPNEANCISDHTYYDSQATELYTLYETQNCTHVSQSQNIDEISINNKLLFKNNNAQPLNTTNYDMESSKTINKDPKTIEFHQKTSESKRKTIEYTAETVINATINEVIENTNVLDENTTETLIENESFPQYAQDIDIQFTENANVIENCKTNLIEHENSEEMNDNVNINDHNKRNETEYENNEENNDNNVNTDNASQIVTFKVVEELNKVKNYINKRIERRLSNDGSIDSGYRSDSQTKCSFRSSLQLSGNWINQSAHSLFEHITQCPLLGTTHEIIGEIAQVLGQLIDKLHEEERYPSFFDELLDNINFLLKDIHQESGGEDVLLQKDEKMQRLLLLNKSMHIQKYTIEKITSLLENVLSHLTNTEEPYEISNINEIENLSYIFHILEVILQRYIRGKNVISQEITNSQLELKKTSITELWRRKWNPNYREDAVQDFTPKKCVLIHCNEVLNKIVVSCMDGYSLVAFAALNCFNILQS